MLPNPKDLNFQKQILKDLDSLTYKFSYKLIRKENQKLHSIILDPKLRHILPTRMIQATN